MSKSLEYACQKAETCKTYLLCLEENDKEMCVHRSINYHM